MKSISALPDLPRYLRLPLTGTCTWTYLLASGLLNLTCCIRWLERTEGYGRGIARSRDSFAVHNTVPLPYINLLIPSPSVYQVRRY